MRSFGGDERWNTHLTAHVALLDVWPRVVVMIVAMCLLKDSGVVAAGRRGLAESGHGDREEGKAEKDK